MAATHRRAEPGDARRLFDVRRESILTLAPKGMTAALVADWAGDLTLAGMEQRVRDLEVWVAEVDGTIAGWGAIYGSRLDGLYIAPEFSGQGIGSDLLNMLERMMRDRGFQAVSAFASSNALAFYLRRGYIQTGPGTPEQGEPIRKTLS